MWYSSSRGNFLSLAPCGCGQKTCRLWWWSVGCFAAASVQQWSETVRQARGGRHLSIRTAPTLTNESPGDPTMVEKRPPPHFWVVGGEPPSYRHLGATPLAKQKEEPILFYRNRDRYIALWLFRPPPPFLPHDSLHERHGWDWHINSSLLLFSSLLPLSA